MITLEQLSKTIESRKANPVQGSYPSTLLEAGENKIIKKLGEEFAETLRAMCRNDKENIIEEASDLVFHLLVALAHYEVSLGEVMQELDNRSNK